MWWRASGTPPRFELSFDIEPTGKLDGWTNIIHLTEGENNTREGDRIPGIWFHGGTTRLLVVMSRQGNMGECIWETEELPLDETTRVTVRLRDRTLAVLFDGRQVGWNDSYDRKHPGRPDVKLYLADPWHEASAALLSNVKYTPYLPNVKSPSDLGPLEWLPEPTAVTPGNLVGSIHTAEQSAGVCPAVASNSCHRRSNAFPEIDP